MNNAQNKTRAVALISGRGSNLQAIIDATKSSNFPVELVAVLSNRTDAAGLQRAADAGIATTVLSHTDFSSRESFDTELRNLIDEFSPDLIVLAGFMRILSEQFVTHYAGRMMNIHPSLLPEFRGLHTHERAIAEGHQEHGASVHFVTAELDGGPVILQGRVPIKPSDSADDLAARVLTIEHQIYPLAVRWFAENRISMRDTTVIFDGHKRETPIQFNQKS